MKFTALAATWIGSGVRSLAVETARAAGGGARRGIGCARRPWNWIERAKSRVLFLLCCTPTRRTACQMIWKGPISIQTISWCDQLGWVKNVLPTNTWKTRDTIVIKNNTWRWPIYGRIWFKQDWKNDWMFVRSTSRTRCAYLWKAPHVSSRRPFFSVPPKLE